MFNYNYTINSWKETIDKVAIITADVQAMEQDYEKEYAATIYKIREYRVPEAIEAEAAEKEARADYEALKAIFPEVKTAFIEAGNLYSAAYDKWYDEVGKNYDWRFLNREGKIYPLYEDIMDMHRLSDRDKLGINWGNSDNISVNVDIHEAHDSMVLAMNNYKRVKWDLEVAKNYLDRCETAFSNCYYEIRSMACDLQRRLDKIALEQFVIDNYELEVSWLQKVKDAMLTKIDSFAVEAEEMYLLNANGSSEKELEKLEALDSKLWAEHKLIDKMVEKELKEIRNNIQSSTTIEAVEAAALAFINKDKNAKAAKSTEFEEVLNQVSKFYSELPAVIQEKISFYTEKEIEKEVGEARKRVLYYSKGSGKAGYQIKQEVAEAEAKKRAEIAETIEDYRDKIYFCQIALEAVKAFRAYDATVEVITDDYLRAMSNFERRYQSFFKYEGRFFHKS